MPRFAAHMNPVTQLKAVFHDEVECAPDHTSDVHPKRDFHNTATPVSKWYQLNPCLALHNRHAQMGAESTVQCQHRGCKDNQIDARKRTYSKLRLIRLCIFRIDSHLGNQ